MPPPNNACDGDSIKTTALKHVTAAADAVPSRQPSKLLASGMEILCFSSALTARSPWNHNHNHNHNHRHHRRRHLHHHNHRRHYSLRLIFFCFSHQFTVRTLQYLCLTWYVHRDYHYNDIVVVFWKIILLTTLLMMVAVVLALAAVSII